MNQPPLSSTKPPINPPPRRAFTLIEMLVATLLMAMLGMAALLVCRNIARQTKTMPQPKPAYPAQVARILERDLTEAHYAFGTTNRVVLQGPMAWRPDLGSRGHWPSTVVWRIERNSALTGAAGPAPALAGSHPADTGLLIREQEDLVNPGQIRREVVLSGVSHIELQTTQAKREIVVEGSALAQPIRVSLSISLGLKSDKKTGNGAGKRSQP